VSTLRPRLLVLVSTCALALGLVPAASASSSPEGGAREPGAALEPAEVTGAPSAPRADKASVMRLGSGPNAERYIVQLADPAVAAYSGGIERLQATPPGAGERLDPSAAPVREYVAHLEAEQDAVRDRIADEIGRAPSVDFTYTYALNGIA